VVYRSLSGERRLAKLLGAGTSTGTRMSVPRYTVTWWREQGWLCSIQVGISMDMCVGIYLLYDQICVRATRAKWTNRWGLVKSGYCRGTGATRTKEGEAAESMPHLLLTEWQKKYCNTI
jgi:hypothetical protein